MLEHFKNQLNSTFTENGAKTHKTTNSYLLDFFSLAGSMRNQPKDKIQSLFSKAFNENPMYAMKTLFFMRDVREGNGERRLFRICNEWLATNEPLTLEKNLIHFAEFGRWDDLIELIESPVKETVLTIIVDQLLQDALKLNNSVSLLAKWIPSKSASSKATKRKAEILRKAMGLDPKTYRQLITELRKEIDILEGKMSKKEWDQVDYSKVPSQAMMKYRQAFLRNDESRYKQYLDALKPDAPLTRAVKINTATLHPYQIVEKVMQHGLSDELRQLYNAMWENLPNVVGEKYQDSLAVIDVSGSMHGQPMNVAISLGLYIAEKNKGKFHNHFITFSNRPQLVEIIGSNFVDKVRNIARADWGMNTDLRKVFQLILDTALKHKLPQSEIPKSLYIISDMQFDEASRTNTDSTFFNQMKTLFASHGYVLPRIVFWNVDARHLQAPVVKDEPNVQLVSGFSQNLFTALMEQREYNPYEFMLDVLNSPRYDKIIS